MDESENPYRAPEQANQVRTPGKYPWWLIELLGGFSVALGLSLGAYNYFAGLKEVAAGQQPNYLRFGHIPVEATCWGLFLIVVAIIVRVRRATQS